MAIPALFSSCAFALFSGSHCSGSWLVHNRFHTLNSRLPITLVYSACPSDSSFRFLPFRFFMMAGTIMTKRRHIETGSLPLPTHLSAGSAEVSPWWP